MMRSLWFTVVYALIASVQPAATLAQAPKDPQGDAKSPGQKPVPAAGPGAADKSKAGDAEPAPQGNPEDWMKATLPHEAHQRLQALAGTWSLAVKTPGGPDGKEAESPGKAQFRSVMGGRFVIEEVQTSLGGEPFEWLGIHGFDNGKKKYVSSWIDNMGTGIDSMEGVWDEAGKTLTYTGHVDDPGAGESSKVKWVMNLGPRDRLLVQMFEVDRTGKETKVLEIAGIRSQ
ncbi:MAG: DUF1579 family protein [Planctomycetes bacterium]|nr:DUF1579 family protein [Planctomycetota bacterium]